MRRIFAVGVRARHAGAMAFKVCAIALKNNSVDRNQLLPGVQAVPHGIGELVSQQQGLSFGAIKAMH